MTSALKLSFKVASAGVSEGDVVEVDDELFLQPASVIVATARSTNSGRTMAMRVMICRATFTIE